MDLMTNLRNQGINLYIITNGNPIQQKNKVKHINWHGMVDNITFIYANEYMPKPDPTSFQQTKIQNLGYIAKLNTEKTQILNVYLDRKTAASHNGYASSSALDTPVKNASLTNGHYYLLYDKCPQELIDTFEEKYGEPILYKDEKGEVLLFASVKEEKTFKFELKNTTPFNKAPEIRFNPTPPHPIIATVSPNLRWD